MKAEAMKALVLATLLLGPTATAHAKDDADIGFAYETSVLAPRVHLLAQREQFRVQPLGNVTLIEQSDGFVLVDAGGTPAAGRQVVAAVRALADKPVKAVVLTHWHGDHVLGAGEILREWPAARLIATAATRDAMAAGLGPYKDPVSLTAALQRVQASFLQQAADKALPAAERDGFARAAAEVATYRGQFEGAEMVLPTEFVDQQLDIPDSEVQVTVRHLGEGNTAGDLVVWLPSARILVAGDLVVRPVPFAFDVWPRSWAGVLRTLSHWDAEVIVPGHGAPLAESGYLLQLAGWLCDAHGRAVALGNAKVAPAGLELSSQAEAIAGTDPWLRRWAKEYWSTPLATSAIRDVATAGPACPRTR